MANRSANNIQLFFAASRPSEEPGATSQLPGQSLSVADVESLLAEVGEASKEEEEIDVVGTVIRSRNLLPLKVKTEPGLAAAIPTPVVPQPPPPQGGAPVAVLLLPEDNPDALKYVEESAAGIGIRLKQEEVAPKIVYPAATKMIYMVSLTWPSLEWHFETCVLLFQACKNLCSALIRKSYQSAWQRLGGPPEQVSAADVRRAIHSNKIFSLFAEDPSERIAEVKLEETAADR